ncbi:MAG TPA: DUF2721 domain-containing protein [Bacteroidota bacterium]
MPLHDLLPILQISIGPVILISGVGLVLLSMTNRFGRVIDRSRHLSRTLHSTEGKEREIAKAQLDVLSVRARLARRAITLAALSILFASFLIVTLFLAAILQREAGPLVAILFILCLGALVASLIDFLRDINLSLAALKLEVESPVNNNLRTQSTMT